MIKDENSYVTAALHSYDNMSCITLEEFKEDLNRVTTIRKCITKYIEDGEINVRLVLNHYIVLFNVFGATAFDLLDYKIDESYRPIAFAFLVKINRLPAGHEIMLDQIIVTQLREI